MKRVIFLAFTLVFALFCNPMSAFATEVDMKFDSIELSNEEKEALGVLEVYSDENTKPELRANDNIVSAIRIYNVSFLYAFTNYFSIDDVLSNNCIKETYFVVEDKEGTLSYFDANYEKLKSNRYAVVDGKEVELPPIDVSTQTLSALNNNEMLKNNIAEDVETYNVYFLSDEANMMGSALYYKTNYGDFVYYYHYDTGELFFTANEFVSFEKNVMEELEKYSEYDGAFSLNQVTDLSKYELVNASTNSLVNASETDVRTSVKTITVFGTIATFAILLIALSLKALNDKRRRVRGE